MTKYTFHLELFQIRCIGTNAIHSKTFEELLISFHASHIFFPTCLQYNESKPIADFYQFWKLQFEVGYKQGTQVNRLRAICGDNTCNNNNRKTKYICNTIFTISCAWLCDARAQQNTNWTCFVYIRFGFYNLLTSWRILA